MSEHIGTPVVVADIQELTPFVKQFTLETRDGSELPPFSGGSHTVVTMKGEAKLYRNAYSLVARTENRKGYIVSIRREDEGRGGSLFMHNNVEVGSELEISTPFNLFAINKTARKHIMIAGGIGITPFMAYLEDLPFLTENYELHYATRERSYGAYADELEARLGDQFKLYCDDNDTRLNLHDLLGDQPLGTHVYVCGPSGMVDAVLQTCEELGWPTASVHFEVFKAPDPGNPFNVTLAKSNKTLTVGPNETLLDVLENNNVDIDWSCRGGACGLCRTAVLDGEVEHRDFFLSDEEKDSNSAIMPCVSRCKSDALVIDL